MWAPFIATGDVYTDGALTGRFRVLKRAGWAIAVLRQDLSIEWATYGVCGELDPSILRAELRAVLEALRVAVPPLVIHTDNAEVVSGVQMGRELACQAAREGADLWRLVWQMLEDIGPGVEVRKVKAHTTEHDVLEGLIERQHHLGNAAADSLAVFARKVAEARVPTAVFRKTCERTLAWYRWCARYVSHWVTDTNAEHDEEGEEGDEHRRNLGPSTVRRSKELELPHSLWSTGGASVQCQRCGLQWASTSLDKVRRRPCRGCPSGRLLARTHHEADVLRLTMSYSVREMEKKGAVPIPDVAQGEEAEEAGTVPEEGQWQEEDPFGHLYSGMGHAEPHVPALEGETARSGELDYSSQQAVEARAHLIRRKGSIAWCEVCGRWAIARVGRGLSGVCSGKLGSYAIRRARLREGRHPLTGRPL